MVMAWGNWCEVVELLTRGSVYHEGEEAGYHAEHGNQEMRRTNRAHKSGARRGRGWLPRGAW
jgi:hypothetical protein